MTTVQWTEVAKDDYIAVLKSAYEESADQAVLLDEKMEALLSNLRQFKHFCPPTLKFIKFRRCILTKHLALVYEVGEESILILSVFDTRMQHPFN
jgi:plasmid stabilization system protein ParE